MSACKLDDEIFVYDDSMFFLCFRHAQNYIFLHHQAKVIFLNVHCIGLDEFVNKYQTQVNGTWCIIDAGRH